MPANSNFHLHISYKEWVDSLLKNPCQCKGDFYPSPPANLDYLKKFRLEVTDYCVQQSQRRKKMAALSGRQLGCNSRGVSPLLAVW